MPRSLDDLPEITQAIPPETFTVELRCPHCGMSDIHSAEDWLINDRAVFKISDVTTYGVDCRACDGVFIFKPLALVV